MANEDTPQKPTPQWAEKRINDLYGVIDQQEDDIVELLGPNFNPLAIGYEKNLKDVPAHAHITRFLTEQAEDEYGYHHDLLAMAMAKQESALQHYETQLALQKLIVSEGRGAARVTMGVQSDREIVERLGLKIGDIREKAVSGELKDEFTSQTMQEHYDRIIGRYLAANKGNVSGELAAFNQQSLLERIANVRFDFATISIGHAGLKIGAVNNRIANLEEVMRFHAEGIINDIRPVTGARIATFAFLKEEHDVARLQLKSASELIKGAGQIRLSNKYVPGALNHTL